MNDFYLVLIEYKNGAIDTRRFSETDSAAAWLCVDDEKQKESVNYVSLYRGNTILAGVRGDHAEPLG